MSFPDPDTKFGEIFRSSIDARCPDRIQSWVDLCVYSTSYTLSVPNFCATPHARPFALIRPHSLASYIYAPSNVPRNYSKTASKYLPMIERCLKISRDDGKKILQVLKAFFSSKKKRQQPKNSLFSRRIFWKNLGIFICPIRLSDRKLTYSKAGSAIRIEIWQKVSWYKSKIRGHFGKQRLRVLKGSSEWIQWIKHFTADPTSASDSW